jgi:ATP-dependent DNA helicase RecQ
MKGYSVKRVVAMLHRLLDAGLAKQRDPDGVKFRPVVALTPQGALVMKGETTPPANLEDLAPRRSIAPEISRAAAKKSRAEEVADADPQTIRRIEALRALRLRLARASDLPPYVVCHDSVLKQIAQEKPGDVAALERIKGMGPYKIKMYGEAFLDVVRTA